MVRTLALGRFSSPSSARGVRWLDLGANKFVHCFGILVRHRFGLEGAVFLFDELRDCLTVWLGRELPQSQTLQLLRIGESVSVASAVIEA
jgi:hypothetical protein